MAKLMCAEPYLASNPVSMLFSTAEPCLPPASSASHSTNQALLPADIDASISERECDLDYHTAEVGYHSPEDVPPPAPPTASEL